MEPREVEDVKEDSDKFDKEVEHKLIVHGDKASIEYGNIASTLVVKDKNII